MAERALEPYEHLGKFLNCVPREDVEIGGARLRAGSLVLLGTGSAQCDEQIFADPFDVARDPRESLAFGRGCHSCLSASRTRHGLVVRGMEALPVERVG